MIRRAVPITAALLAGALAAVLVMLGLGLGHHRAADGPADRPAAADVGFSQDMAVHHEQAILMGDLALTHGTRAVQPLAQTILTNQSQEIGLMRGWLRLWHRPSVDPHPMGWMGSGSMAGMDMSAGTMSADSMPGMASPGQLNRLYGLTGQKFDVLFLQLMIRHHLGGIAMAKAAIADARLPVVREAARSMIVEQVEDIATMRALLRLDGGTELPAP